MAGSLLAGHCWLDAVGWFTVGWFTVGWTTVGWFTVGWTLLTGSMLAGHCWLVHGWLVYSWLFEDAVSSAVLVHSLRSALELSSRTIVNNRQIDLKRENIFASYWHVIERVFVTIYKYSYLCI